MSRLAITDLRLNQCRYPVTPDNAPRHFFCGEPVEHEKSPYCPEHAARCFDRRADVVKKAAAERAAVARAAKTRGLAPNMRPAMRTPKF